ncbi:MAG: helicase [Eubacteriaceae bacterium]|nr:helicase [Eubacteriaceae bacterium]
MGFFDSMKEVITQKPTNLKSPYFYKIDSDNEKQLEQLKEFYKIASDNVKQQVERDIKMLSYGIAGENNVAFELNNSYLPIIVLHDLYLECDGLSAQIDYLIVTTKFSLVVECKNLIGNIEVNSNGEFIRTTEYNGKYKKEGIYSPITQNNRHLEMIKKVRSSSKNNLLTKTIFEKSFDENYKSVVVLANPKTIINMKYAKKEIKEQIIRSDQLITYIKKLINESKNPVSFEKQMYEIADFFLNLHTTNNVDYTKKYSIDDSEEKVSEKKEIEPTINIVEEAPLYKDLKQYRYETSKAEGVKPYFIYNNAQMQELISSMPGNLDDIKKISGFGEVKCQKYGNAILEIIKEYRS